MRKLIKYSLIVIAILIVGLIIGYGIFLSTFDLFGEPEKEILDTNCDYEGLRQATTYNFGGNAVTVPLIAVSIDLGCSDKPKDKVKIVIFSAEHRGGKVETDWISFDTLKVFYTKNLRPITLVDSVTFDDSSLDLVIVYETDSSNNTTEYKEYLGEYLNPIRIKVKKIDSISSWTAIDKRGIETDSANGVGEYYFLHGNLKKIVQIQLGKNTRRETEFYLDNDSLFFVFEKLIDSLELKKEPEFFEPYLDSIFFRNGELIRIIANMDCGAPFSEDYRLEEQIRLKNELKILINKLNRK
ncbi:hypothetical protein [Carboxylicivirga sp. N1Y90]|uniref:hypothetical protein n=1 Tax=Carboxylicivirga fragile TaxID=3417571 RepID=UPI003D346770|nr:hypothetical protein [Marinilabiliaceae bacterium N1Y90]